jgi:hypothetical protein
MLCFWRVWRVQKPVLRARKLLQPVASTIFALVQEKQQRTILQKPEWFLPNRGVRIFLSIRILDVFGRGKF